MAKRPRLANKERLRLKFERCATADNRLKAAVQYVVDAKYAPLPENPFVLLQHVTECAKLVDDLFVLVSDEAVARNCVSNLKTICYEWHKECRIRNNVGDVSDFTLVISWSTLCRLHAADYRFCRGPSGGSCWAELASDGFKFVQWVSERELMVTSDEAIDEYSVDVLWDSLCQVFGKTISYVHSEEMRCYFAALFLRYCDVFAFKQDASVFDNYLYCIPVPEEEEKEERSTTADGGTKGVAYWNYRDKRRSIFVSVIRHRYRDVGIRNGEKVSLFYVAEQQSAAVLRIDIVRRAHARRCRFRTFSNNRGNLCRGFFYGKLVYRNNADVLDKRAERAFATNVRGAVRTRTI